MLLARAFIVILAFGILMALLAGEAQPVGKIPKIGLLINPGKGDHRFEFMEAAFMQGLRDLGWVEERNVTVERRYAEGRAERLPDLAAELVGIPVDVLVVWGVQSVAAAKKVTSTVPVVFIGAGDPVGSGLIASLARPGGNLTGLGAVVGPEIAGKRLQLLKEVVPRLTRVGVLADRAQLGTEDRLREIKAAASSMRIQVEVFKVSQPAEFDSTFMEMKKERVGALLVLGSALTWPHRAKIVKLAAQSRLPASYWTRDPVEDGGLMSYGFSFTDLSRRAARYVDEILKGAKPADLPVEQPMRFELVVNMKTAKALGLTIPQSVLIRADHLIQ